MCETVTIGANNWIFVTKILKNTVLMSGNC